MEVEDADLALAPSSKHGDEGIQEGVEISGAYEENIILQSNESDSEVRPTTTLSLSLTDCLADVLMDDMRTIFLVPIG